jgi:hypothetical protein
MLFFRVKRFSAPSSEGYRYFYLENSQGTRARHQLGLEVLRHQGYRARSSKHN